MINLEENKVQPPCVHFGVCGGCALQDMAALDYQAHKEKMALELLDKVGLKPQQLLPSVFIEPYTRRRATFAVRRDKTLVQIGFNKRGSNDVEWISECHIVVPEIMAAMPALKKLLGVILAGAQQVDVSVLWMGTMLDVLIMPFDESKLTLKTRMLIPQMLEGTVIGRVAGQLDAYSTPSIIIEKSPMTMHFGRTDIFVPPAVFLQPSVTGEAALVNAVQTGLGKAKKVADLFSGLGTFALTIEEGRKVDAYDADGAAIAALEKAVRANGNIKAIKRQLYKDPVTAKELKSYDGIIFDPPRAGAKAQAVEIAQSGVKTIVAVSCNPRSFVDDVRSLIKEGYVFETLQIIDQFTWSNHVELVAKFIR